MVNNREEIEAFLGWLIFMKRHLIFRVEVADESEGLPTLVLIDNIGELVSEYIERGTE